MSDPRMPKLPAKKRVVTHERVVTAQPALLSPEEEDFNRFLEDLEAEAAPAPKKPDSKPKS
jgi:hypothetical protein